MADRYNPFGLDYLRGPADQPSYSVDSRWPDQPDVASAFKMGGLAGTDEYAPATYAPFEAYDRAQQAQHRDEKQAQNVQRSADVAASLSGQQGPVDIRPVLKGMKMGDLAGEMLAPDDVFGATTALNPVRALGKAGRAVPAIAGAVLGSDPAEAGVLSKARAVLGGKVGGPTPTGIHVYHSSPHDFDKFDLGKIGTGEGAQAYGHGIYAAENPAVSGQGGQYWQQFSGRFPKHEELAAGYLQETGFDRAKAIELARQEGARISVPALRDRIEQASALLKGGAPVGPRTYEVNFKAKPEELLDWDKPLAQHPETVRESLLNTLEEGPFRRLPRDRVLENALEGVPGHPTGETLYRHLADRSGSHVQPLVSERMRMNGISGIRYLDEGSRGQKYWVARHPQGGTREYPDEAGVRAFIARNPEYALEAPKITHNYVAFDPSKLDIMAKYGVVGGVPLGALAATDRYEAER